LSQSLSDSLEISNHLKKLRYLAWHCGIREADLILGRFIEVHLQRLNVPDCELLQRVLEDKSHEIMDWILGLKTAPEDYAEIITKIKDYALFSYAIPPREAENRGES